MSRAVLPEGNYARPETLHIDGERIVVTVFEERTGRKKEFAFHEFPVARALSETFARGYARATGPGGSRRTIGSAMFLHSTLRSYARYLAAHPDAPSSPTELRTAHLRELRFKRDRQSYEQLLALRVVLRGDSSVPTAYRELLLSPLRAVPHKQRIEAYTASEFRSIRRSMRAIVRGALTRVQAAEAEVAGVLSSGVLETDRDFVLWMLGKKGDVPRTAKGLQAVPRSHMIARELLPSMQEMAAAAVLMQCLTGHNIGTLLELTADHHRADDQRAESAMVLTDARKPRRGRYRAELNLAFDASDVWEETSAGDDDFASPAGIYRIVLELGSRSRNIAGSRRLFVGFSGARTSALCRPLAELAGHRRRLIWSHSGQAHAGVDTMRIRRSFLELRQRPVDHTPATLADTYLSKDPAALASNQRVVADALDDEMQRVQTAARVTALTPEQVTAASTDPEGVAAAIGVDVETLADLLAGRLDTVATACVSNTTSPYSRAGDACTASFLLCLGCSNARVEPRHVPIQRVLRDRLEARRAEMLPVEWEARFGTAHGRVLDLLERMPGAPQDDGAASETAGLIDQLLDGRWDLR
ncbi:hypothetical protein [Microbacterium aurantiacum]|uniref:hypothetical protein n=1 Tax=Microbacterium aurantiacum TaxID=162393 RepID=UPI00342429D7